MLTSVVIPVYNEEENILLLYNELVSCLDGKYELLFVDDGSSDATPLIIQRLSENDLNVRGLILSRNFGHQHALMAGLQHVSGEYIITMDGDLQHPPALLPEMLEKLKHHDIVLTKRSKTEDAGVLKRTFSKGFYRFINFISDTRIEPDSSDFRGFSRKVLKSILEFKEKDIFLRGIIGWVGYKSAVLEYTARSRKYGKSKYSFRRMLGLALRGITAFSFKPLRVAFFFGSIISLAAFAFGIFALVSYYRGATVAGWASTIIAITFLGGVQLLAIGLLGEYIASLFTETKNRPLYLVDKKINIH
jgi:polyisoprenyl-phosphate glycosyltransferase